MNEFFLALVDGLMSSLWLYVVLLALAAFDAFLPIVPSETLVITAGVFAAHGDPSLFGVIAVAAIGALLGDHTSYFLGHRLGAKRLARLRPGTQRQVAFGWAERALVERGGLVLVVARYIPGARTVVTLTMGAVSYPVRSFSTFAVLAAGCWAVYFSLVGYLGGAAFEQEPLKGLLFGIGLALIVTIMVEVVRVRRRRAASTIASDDSKTTIRQTEGALQR